MFHGISQVQQGTLLSRDGGQGKERDDSEVRGQLVLIIEDSSDFEKFRQQISNIHRMNLIDFDLNLLVALDALLEEQHVTRAAKRVGLSQPAMSNALSRLRAELDDPLLVRTGTGMTPTPRALELIEPVKKALAMIDSALSSEPFAPENATAKVHVTGTSGALHGLVGRLLEEVNARAPGVEITFGLFSMLEDPEDALRQGTTDLVLATSDALALSTSLEREVLATRRSFALVKHTHPLVSAKSLTEAALEDFERIPEGTSALAPDLLSAVSLLLATERWMRAEEEVAMFLANHPDLASIPLEGSERDVAMFWHQRTDLDATSRWLRQTIRTLID